MAAIAAVSAAVGCEVEVRKISRCSDVGSQLADHLSKGEFGSCRQLSQQLGWPLVVELAGVHAGGAGQVDRQAGAK